MRNLPYPAEKWHNIRIVRTDGSVATDYEMSVADAVETAIFHNLGIVGVAKVEWRGAHIGQPYTDQETGKVVSPWRDVTEHYKNLYHEGTSAQ